MTDPKRVVAEGYDAMADRFAEWQAEIRGMTGPARAEELLSLLPERSDVLELGVGAGVEQSRLLASRSRLTAVDISGEQLRRARERLPEARLIQADMTQLDFDEASFDAVTSFYALNNVPRDELGPLIGAIARWLRPGGYFLGAFGAGDTPAWQGEWLGVPMFFSGFESAVNDRLVREAGLDLLRSEIETIHEPEGDARFHWILAREPI